MKSLPIIFCLFAASVIAVCSAETKRNENITPSTATQAAESLSDADRKRIEGYGEAFVRALNSGNPDEYARAVLEIYAKSTLEKIGETRLRDQMTRLRQSLGETEYHHSEVVGDHPRYFMHVYVRTKGEKRWSDLQFQLDSASPHKLAQLVFIASVAEPVTLPNGDITDAATLRWLDRYIDKLIADNDLAGAVMLAKGTAPFHERAFGFADAERRVKNTLDTRFNLGSGNKMFTAIAVAQLVEKGKLKYSDPISKFLPDFPDKAFARKATIHHLLSHTSGVKEYWTEEFDKKRAVIRDMKGMLPWIYKVGTAFEPGTRQVYSNSNFVIAGLIVEKASGTDYFTYIRKNIYEPLGMTATDSYPTDGSVPNLAKPLKRGENGWEVAPQGLRGSAAGGGYSTVHDMLKFARGFWAGKLVSPETVKLMTTPRAAPEVTDFDYGYGFLLHDEGKVASFGHGGIAKGVNLAFRYFPGPDVTMVIFCNQDNGAHDDLNKNIVKLITGDR